jgi:hypothetical protein|tara:strand:- start:248 stop:451 length:204 start_codon:yes stop_codon:yes gene_type:complete
MIKTKDLKKFKKAIEEAIKDLPRDINMSSGTARSYTRDKIYDRLMDEFQVKNLKSSEVPPLEIEMST